MATTTKADLRKELLIRRNALDGSQRLKHSSLIRQRIFQNPTWKNAETLLCYVSFGSEVETHMLIQEAIRFKKKVIVPLHDPANHTTLLSELGRYSDLGPNHRGILQVKPECQRLIEPTRVQLALIPGIVFDRQGGRIGFGGGYFDKLLPLMPKAFRMGLAFSAQMSDTGLPLESHDVLLHAIVTENEIIDTKAK